MSREEFYDEKISPLMSQIIALCAEGEIPMLADFALDWDEDEQNFLKCTTVMLNEEWEPPEEMIKAVNILLPSQQSPMMVTVRDGDGNVKEIHSILQLETTMPSEKEQLLIRLKEAAERCEKEFTVDVSGKKIINIHAICEFKDSTSEIINEARENGWGDIAEAATDSHDKIVKKALDIIERTENV